MVRSPFRLRQSSTLSLFHATFSHTTKMWREKRVSFIQPSVKKMFGTRDHVRPGAKKPTRESHASPGVSFSACFGGKSAKTGRKKGFAGAAALATPAGESPPERLQTSEHTFMYRLAILNSHPIQYFTPLYQRIAQEPDIDLTVYYCTDWGLTAFVDPGFATKIEWDVPLLAGYRSVFLTNHRRQGSERNFFSLINPEIVRELWHGRYDALLVHGHQYMTNLIAVVAARVLNISIMMRCDSHLGRRRSVIKQAVHKQFLRGFYHLCDICLPIGSRNAAFYRYHGVPDKRLFTVPFAVNNDFFIHGVEQHRHQLHVTKSKLGISLDKPVILFASKLIPRKRPWDLLQAYHRLQLSGVQATLLFVGSGSEMERLRAYTIQHNLQDIYFLGFQNQTMLLQFYAIADVFVLPSENEPWGLVINEAMCAGLPIIATEEIGAVADLVQHGENGFVFQTGDIENLACYLYLLIMNDTLRQRMGQCSLTRITSCNFEHSLQGIRMALNSITTGTRIV